jgi:protein-tyrosine-phosphatase
MCRSPLAQGLLRLRVGKDNPEWKIASAGTWATDGAPASYNSFLVLQERDYDLSNHRSRSIDRALVDAYQLILVMERGHKEALRLEFPTAGDRIFLLSEMIGQDFSIPDPVGGPFEEYQGTAREIDAILERGMNKILRLSEEHQQAG